MCGSAIVKCGSKSTHIGQEDRDVVCYSEATSSGPPPSYMPPMQSDHGAFDFGLQALGALNEICTCDATYDAG
eukprot:6105723-Amphidinium_carterae.1